jgi:peroxiredoxin
MILAPLARGLGVLKTMQSKYFLLATLALNNAVWAADAPPVPLEPVTAGIKLLPQPGVRIGDIAPQFAFPSPDGKLWSLRDQRGQKSVLLILTGEAPVLVSNRVADPAVALVAVVNAANDLKKTGVETVLISKAAGIDIGEFNKELGLLALNDEQGEMAKLFNVSPTGMTLVSIDRAGFLRDVQTINDVADVAPRMFKMADLTPKIEIGKPAPDFAVADMNGTVRRLSDLRGQKNLLLTFFPKCFTGG